MNVRRCYVIRVRYLSRLMTKRVLRGLNTNHSAVKFYKMLTCRGSLELKNKGLIFLQIVVEMLP
jgi:hypothetical protein